MKELEGYEEIYGRNGYTFYRKIVDGKGKWKAKKDGKIIDITYEQARGFEPLDSEEKLQMTLGKLLLGGR